MNKKTRNLWLLFIIVLATRLPFVWYGYGSDSDSWRVARAARNIALSEEYQYSRPPGYPLQELFAALIWQAGAPALNILTAVFSTFAVVSFYLILKHYKCRDAFLASLGLAFTPVIFIHSTDSMDYLWALALLLLSLFALLQQKLLLSGIFLGLASGCRLTSLVLALPFALLIFRKNSFRATLFFLASVIVAAVLCFSPVLHRYGLSFLTYYQGPLPGKSLVLYMATIGVWGAAGMLGLGLALLTLIIHQLIKKNFPTSIDRIPNLPLLCGVLLYFLIFLQLPMSSGYLIPLVPFVLMFAGKYIPRTAFQGLCLLLLAAPFVSWDQGTFSNGPLIKDQQKRRESLQVINNVLTFIDQTRDQAVIVTGPWGPQLTYHQSRLNNPLVKLAYVLTEEEVNTYQRQGRQIFYLPLIKEYNQAFGKVDLDKYGAKLLR